MTWYEVKRPIARRGKSGWNSPTIARFFRNHQRPELVVVEAEIRRKDETRHGWAAYAAGTWLGFRDSLEDACELAQSYHRG